MYSSPFLAENKITIVKAGALPPLIILLNAADSEVQCNACGCITTLATTEHNKREIVVHGAIPPLLKLAHIRDSRVQRNAAGALLNLTHVGMSPFNQCTRFYFHFFERVESSGIGAIRRSGCLYQATRVERY